MAVVIGGIVDQDRHATKITNGRCAGRSQRLDIEKVHLIKQRGVGSPGIDTTLNRRPGIGRVLVHEGDAASLAGELLHNRTADAIGTASYKHSAIHERRVAGVVGGHDDK